MKIRQYIEFGSTAFACDCCGVDLEHRKGCLWHPDKVVVSTLNPFTMFSKLIPSDCVHAGKYCDYPNIFEVEEFGK